MIIELDFGTIKPSKKINRELNIVSIYKPIFGDLSSIGWNGKVLVKCPFHNDNTKSAGINPKDGFFHCFVCDVTYWNTWQFMQAYKEIDKEYATSVMRKYYAYKLNAEEQAERKRVENENRLKVQEQVKDLKARVMLKKAILAMYPTIRPGEISKWTWDGGEYLMHWDRPEGGCVVMDLNGELAGHQEDGIKYWQHRLNVENIKERV